MRSSILMRLSSNLLYIIFSYNNLVINNGIFVYHRFVKMLPSPSSPLKRFQFDTFVIDAWIFALSRLIRVCVLFRMRRLMFVPSVSHRSLSATSISGLWCSFLSIASLSSMTFISSPPWAVVCFNGAGIVCPIDTVYPTLFSSMGSVGNSTSILRYDSSVSDIYLLHVGLSVVFKLYVDTPSDNLSTNVSSFMLKTVHSRAPFFIIVVVSFAQESLNCQTFLSWGPLPKNRYVKRGAITCWINSKESPTDSKMFLLQQRSGQYLSEWVHPNKSMNLYEIHVHRRLYGYIF